MIKLENTVTPSPEQWRMIIMGARNAMNSWDRSDSEIKYENVRDSTGKFVIGPNDHELMMKLRNAGTDHRKFMRMIVVYVDITAPLYWWKEFDTYKVGTVANSCSTMHKIHAKEFTLEDFSCEHLFDGSNLIKDQEVKNELDVYEKYKYEGYILANGEHDLMEIEYEDRTEYMSPKDLMNMYVVNMLNHYREKFLETKDKKYWWQMIQLLPSSYNQKRTVKLNYEVLANIYKSRKNHKLDEWRELCKWIESLPYSEIIAGEAANEE